MDADTLLLGLRGAGFHVALSGDGFTVSPRSALTDDQRRAVQAERNAVLSALKHEAEVKALLVASIDRCCDARGDDDTNRAGLLVECASLSPDGQEDMRQHFEDEAARWKRAAGLGEPA